MSNRLPVFFIGHGSPMNALEENPFTRSWRDMFKGLENVRALVMISAHWVTRGTYITAMDSPRTIHDFWGFPAQLYQVIYPAKGSPSIAQELIQALKAYSPLADYEWGLDHGTWSILVHALPEAKIPVLQLSLDSTALPQQLFAIGQSLRPLREHGILLCASGNIVHNLHLLDWSRMKDIGYAYEWANEASSIVREHLLSRNWQKLVDFYSLPKSVQLAINSAEHYLPLIYILGAAYEAEAIELFNDLAVGGALSMTSVRFG